MRSVATNVTMGRGDGRATYASDMMASALTESPEKNAALEKERELKRLTEELEEQKRRLPRWNFRNFEIFLF